MTFGHGWYDDGSMDKPSLDDITVDLLRSKLNDVFERINQRAREKEFAVRDSRIENKGN